MRTGSVQETVDQAVREIRARWQGVPKVAMILGTGLGDLADHISADAKIPYRDIPNFPHSTALSHKSLLVCGALQGVPVVTMQGRCHLYEGYPVAQLALPVRVMSALGAELLIVSNASGGMNPNYAAGDIMVLDDHINLMWTSPQSDHLESDQLESDDLQRPVDRRGGAPRVYDPELIELALNVSRREQFVAHRGVYVSVTGPTYETRAEYRLFAKIGGDVVGMSTVPEAIAANQCNMRTLALSLVTNVAKPDAPDIVDAEDVVEVAAGAAPNMLHIVMEVLRQQTR